MNLSYGSERSASSDFTLGQRKKKPAGGDDWKKRVATGWGIVVKRFAALDSWTEAAAKLGIVK